MSLNPVTVNVQMKLTIQETLTLDPAASGTPQTQVVTHSGMDYAPAALTSSTTPPAVGCALCTITMSSGSATISLESLTTQLGPVVTGAGYRVQQIKLQAPSTNAAVITLVPDSGSNPYSASGGSFIFAASGQISLTPGDEVQWTNRSGTAAPVVSSTVKNLSLSGTGADQLNIEIVFG
jgi:hypothetical protein